MTQENEQQDNNQPAPTNQRQVTGSFQDRFEGAYQEVTSGGWALFSHNALKVFLLISGAISFVWFSRLMPRLILDPEIYPSAAPFVAGFVGVMSMEGMMFLWDKARQRTGLSLPQIWIANSGLLMAFVAASATTIAAIASAVGGTQDAVTSTILQVSGTGLIGYYVAVQVALAMGYGLMGNAARQALHVAKVDAQHTKASEKRAKAIADAELAAHVATLDDVRTVAKIGALATHRRLITDMAREYNLTPDLAAKLFEEIQDNNADVPIIDNDTGGVLDGARRFFGRRS